MKYLLLQETTDWDAPNHIYITNETKDRVFGYFPYPSGIQGIPSNHQAERFAKPMQFYTKGRKFKTLAKFDA